MVTIRGQFERAGVATANIVLQQTSPTLNSNSATSWGATNALSVNFANLSQAAAMLVKTKVAGDRGVQSVFVSTTGPTLTASAAATTAGYRQAVQNALANARMMATADELVLGAQADITAGVSGGAAALIPNPPSSGPNQKLLAVTITYRTTKG